jgi:hypothetical protein
MADGTLRVAIEDDLFNTRALVVMRKDGSFQLWNEAREKTSGLRSQFNPGRGGAGLKGQDERKQRALDTGPATQRLTLCPKTLTQADLVIHGEQQDPSLPKKPASPPSSTSTASQADAPLSKEELERRQEILGRHQGRLDKLTEQYKDYPNLTEILTSAIWDILREEGEDVPPNTRYA